MATVGGRPPDGRLSGSSYFSFALQIAFIEQTSSFELIWVGSLVSYESCCPRMLHSTLVLSCLVLSYLKRGLLICMKLNRSGCTCCIVFCRFSQWMASREWCASAAAWLKRTTATSASSVSAPKACASTTATAATRRPTRATARTACSRRRAPRPSDSPPRCRSRSPRSRCTDETRGRDEKHWWLLLFACALCSRFSSLPSGPLYAQLCALSFAAVCLLFLCRLSDSFLLFSVFCFRRARTQYTSFLLALNL